ncbi:MAG TPA: Gfo/Idh/MocA family oxidoreductase [Candidatus Limnocylindrales bacterium]|jgi:predicted dehydrogenase|nr:Gfo/Idh/MocA family oxidoreductase [Candidatus Limnocylindrales bacterium]
MNDNEIFNRRDFLKGSSAATLMTMLGSGVELFAQSNTPPDAPKKLLGPTVKVAVIGLGAWGREIVNTLARLDPSDVQAEIAAICDSYPAFLRRASSLAPKAAQVEDYKTILDNKDIPAVVIATPTHQHKDIVLAALKAGKHVYCEAPLANSIEDARTIASAAKAAKQVVFQAGLQMRSEPQRRFLLPFIRSGALGPFVKARAQFHKKQSWRATSPNPEREKQLNWRLEKAISIGLIGEIGSHAIDQAMWFMNAKPVSVTGFGSIAFWKQDGRDVPDTVEAIIEFPNKVLMNYEATLANSFDGEYEILYGSDAAVMMRENKAWMFKEADSPLLGWEVYARKETFYHETGIALVANASKSVNTGDQGQPQPFTNTPLSEALKNFLLNSADVTAAKEDFITNFGADDQDGMSEHLLKVKRDKGRAAAGYLEGFQAAAIGIKANEAILSGQRVELKPDLYELG